MNLRSYQCRVKLSRMRRARQWYNSHDKICPDEPKDFREMRSSFVAGFVPCGCLLSGNAANDLFSSSTADFIHDECRKFVATGFTQIGIYLRDRAVSRMSRFDDCGNGKWIGRGLVWRHA